MMELFGIAIDEEIEEIEEDIQWVNSQRRYHARTHTLDVLKRELKRLKGLRDKAKKIKDKGENHG